MLFIIQHLNIPKTLETTKHYEPIRKKTVDLRFFKVSKMIKKWTLRCWFETFSANKTLRKDWI